MQIKCVKKTNSSLSSLHSLSQNLSEGKYKNFEEFKADAQLIVHNTAILYGGGSSTRGSVLRLDVIEVSFHVNIVF